MALRSASSSDDVCENLGAIGYDPPTQILFREVHVVHAVGPELQPAQILHQAT